MLFLKNDKTRIYLYFNKIILYKKILRCCRCYKLDFPFSEKIKNRNNNMKIKFIRFRSLLNSAFNLN